MRKKIVIQTTLFLCFAVVLPLYALKVWNTQVITDFHVYYKAAVRAKAHLWSEIYNLKDGANPFRYPPVWIPVFRPFAEVGIQQALLIWYFLQFAFFGAGFYWIYRSLRLFRKSQAEWITCLTILYILRFCLDTFTIGQVSSLMFLGFSLAFYSWIRMRPSAGGVFGASLFIPTFFKIGPGFLYGLLISKPLGHWKRVLLGAAGGALAFVALMAFVVPMNSFQQLWQDWVQVVVNDSNYYDASHYGSQSIKSFLLRLAKNQVLSVPQAEAIHLGMVLGVCSAILGFWFLRRPKNLYGRGLSFALGLFAYIWLMPETFKYSLTPLAIPVALLLSSTKPTLLTRLALVIGVFTLTLAGKDIIQDTLFFGMQQWSIPLFTSFLLAGAVVSELILNSKWAFQKKEKLGPWETLPQHQRTLEASVLLPIPLFASISLDSAQITKQVKELWNTFDEIHSGQFEILLLFYGDRYSQFNPLVMNLDELQLPQVKRHFDPDWSGRGQILRKGFLISQGKTLYLSSVEQPCDPVFFKNASEKLKQGHDLVRGNRRLPQSQFRIPVRTLPYVYGRHRVSLLFNQFLRSLFPLKSNDIHSGFYGISWPLAVQIFAVQSSPDFLFDLELGLVAVACAFKEVDIPVQITLEEEKPSTRVALETFQILKGTPRLYWRFQKKFYNLATQPTGLTADDWGISPGVNQGILRLAAKGVIRRVSIMSDGFFVKEGLEDLLLSGVELGLHFNLTYGPNRNHSPGSLLKAWLNPLSDKKILRENTCSQLNRQLMELNSIGVLPSYLDGHHHIHLIPGILDAVAHVLHTHSIKQIRLPYDSGLWLTPKFPLNILSLLAKSRLKHHGFSSRPCLYPPSHYFSDQGRLRAKLARNPTAEVIVHPAQTGDLADLEFPDPYNHQRVIEFKALQMLRTDL